MRSSSLFGRVLLWAPFGVVALFVIIPLYWLIVSSLKPVSELGSPNIIPTTLTLENYVIALGQTDIPLWMLNTSIIAIATTAIGLVICSMAAFSFARFQFRGKTVLFALVLASLTLPEYVTVIPSFVIMRQLGLLNTFLAVILPLAAHALPVFLMRQYITQLPEEMFDAARVDGASQWSIFSRLTVPLIRPGLAASGLIIFLASWNAYLLPLVMLRDPSQYTMPLGLGFLHGQLGQNVGAYNPWAAITAGTVISAVPLVVCLLVMQRHFISGLTQGSVR
jgi:ABC-type glycerol-3-phosphate transport system permease component